MRIVVIEPHCDDAFLSLGWHLQALWKEHDRTIITVFSEPKRSSEAEAYAKAIGAKSISLGLQESDMNGTTEPRPIPEVRRVLEKVKWDQICFPLGLQHPDHLSTSLSSVEDAFFYLDTPYQIKQKLAEELLNAVEGLEIYSICFPPMNKWRHVPIFKSQSKFFYYNQNLKEFKLPEMVLCPKS